LWALLLLVSVPIGVYALRYWSGDPALLPHELRLNLLHNPPAFILHTSFGGLALLLAPWQFNGWLRRRQPALHRWIGRAYVGCVLISGVAAYSVALGTFAGPIASAGFSLMATAWLGTTFIAWRAVRQRRYEAHRRWMVRSFALSLSAETLRIALLVPMQIQMDFLPIYRLTSWASWILNLLMAELWLRFGAQAEGQLVAAAPPHGVMGVATSSHTSNGRIMVRDRTARPE
jgi:hypothetical protein